MKSVVKTCSAFSFVELMIVVAILGILAAIVFPEFQGHTQRAKEAAAKDNLRILRQAIERYAAEHNGVPPGYPSNNPKAPATYPALYLALVSGHYLSEIPANPLNNLSTVLMIQDKDFFPAEATGTYGWMYKPKTHEIRLDYPNTDTSGTLYFTY